MLSTLAIFLYRYEEYIIRKNYIIQVNTACDKTSEFCFTEDDSIFYKKVTIRAKDAPSCLQEHNCSNFSCDSLISDCRIEYCSNNTKAESETCSNLNN